MAKGWVRQTKRAIAKAVMQTKVDIDLLCMRHHQDFPSSQRVQFLVERNISLDLMDRGTWTEVCRLQCCLSRIRKIINNRGILTLGRLTVGAIVKYLVPGMVGNFRIDEYTLLDF